MRSRRFVALALLSLGLASGGATVACFDLFHSTSDLLSACQLDASTPACGPPSTDAGLDFCAWSSIEAGQHAQHACAWLGACETPMGRNAFGSCMFEALLAFDCAANPNHRVAVKTHDLWECLVRVKSCADVDACVFPRGTQDCASAGDYTACGTAEGGTVNNFDVRLECTDGGSQPYPHAHGENCMLWGQTCTYGEAGAACTQDDAGPLQCSDDSCGGTAITGCPGGASFTVDCAQQGLGACQLVTTDKQLRTRAACTPP